MRVNTARSIETANAVYSHFGSWKAAKESARFEDGKFIVPGATFGAGAAPSGERRAESGQTRIR